MALFTFFLNPSADIHLILNPAGRKSIQLDVTGFDDTTGPVGSVLGNSVFTIADPAIATVTTGGLLTAVKEGITFLTVEQTGTTLQLVARIWVHDSIVSFIPGNKTASVNAGTDNLLLSVFAEFSKGDIEDVTAHPYFSFQSANTGIAQVNNASGRVTGVAAGTTTITITELITNTVITPTPININVNESLTTGRPIVEKITFKGYGPEKRNILFLAEGFTLGEKSKFMEIVRAIDKAMRNSILHEPYKLLSNDYNTWIAFEPSTEAGVTIGPSLSWKENVITNTSFLSPVLPNESVTSVASFTTFQLVDLVGLPTKEQKDSSVFTKPVALATFNAIPGFNPALLSDTIFGIWQGNINETKVKPVNTALGLINGRRLGDRFAKPDNHDKPDNTWYRSIPGSPDFFFKDSRKIASGKMFFDSMAFFNNAPHLTTLWTSDFFEYLNSLSELSPATAGFVIGNKWNLGGDDQGLTIIIVNNDYFSRGNYLTSPNIFGIIGIGNEVGIDLPALNGIDLAEYTPLSVSLSGRFMQNIIATAIHELSHGIGLGDEYEDLSDSGKLSPASGDIDLIEIFNNLNTIQNINLHGTKWEFRYFRINKSSALISDSIVGTTANTLELDLFPGEGSKWTVDEEVLLITRNLNGEASFRLYPLHNSHGVQMSGVLTISAKTGDKVTVSGASLTTTSLFPKGSMLFIPKILGSAFLGIHLPGVIEYLNNGRGLFPPPPANFNLHKIDLTRLFSSKNGNCATANTAMTPTPLPIPHVSISGSIKHRLLGLHEGAGTFNCGVVRAAAVCKMRSQYMWGKGHFRFCHLCKYVIVQEFNPSKHSNLESQYPGSPS